MRYPTKQNTTDKQITEPTQNVVNLDEVDEDKSYTNLSKIQISNNELKNY